MAPPIIVLLKPMFMVMCLACEFLWRSFGVYSLLRVKGCPIRESYDSEDESKIASHSQEPNYGAE